MRGIAIVAVSAAVLLAGCARKADDIRATYQDAGRYDGFLCHQLRDEAQRVAHAAAEAYDEQNSKSSITGVVTVPRSLFRRGEGSYATVARLKGQMQAIESASARKNCGVLFRAGTDGEAPQFTGDIASAPRAVVGGRSIYNAPRM